MNDPEHPVVVIGAGPVGLAAAAHLSERNIPFLVLEAGAAVGAAIREWGHVQLFSPWRYSIDGAARNLLEATGWVAPDPDRLPTGHELVDHYLTPLGEVLGAALRTSHEVIAVTRLNMDKTRSCGRDAAPFLVRVHTDQGNIVDLLARNVIDASGSWGHPNPLGRGGLPALGEDVARRNRHVTKPLPNVSADRERFAGKRILVVGGGHSAATTLLELAELRTSAPETVIHWLTRSEDLSRIYGGGEGDELEARGTLGTRLKELVEARSISVHKACNITAITADQDDAIWVRGVTPTGEMELLVDILVPATGFRPDLSILSELRIDLDLAVEAPRQLGPMIDAEFHSCGTVAPHGEKELAHPEHGFYIVGMKSYGRAPTFLMATGYEQVRSIAAALAGDRQAADSVQLVLPETGVCSANLPPRNSRDSGSSPQDALQLAGNCCE